MTSYSGSTSKIVLSQDSDDEKKAKSKWHILLGVCTLFALLALIFIILYAVKVADDKTAKQSGQVGNTEKPTKKPVVTKKTPTSTSLPMPTSTGNEPFLNVRLPKHVVPIHYDVAINIDLKNGRYNGTSTVTFEVKQLTNYIYIHIAMMKIQMSRIMQSDGTDLQVQSKFYFKKNEFYVFKMANPVAIGTYKMYFKYNAPLATDLKGLYKSTYKRKDGRQVNIAATQFQPTDARRAFPCFDEPAMRATFNMTLIHDPSYIAITNMPKISSKTMNGLTEDRFQKTVKMPTYLLAIAICDFKNKSTTTTSGVSMTYFAPPDQVEQLNYAVFAGTKMLPYFERYYNISYPLPKADMIAIPDFAAGAMENWGLITYRETALLYSPGESSESNKQRVAVVISHELVHQWFGNLVTPEWWSDLWLNEGFASYVEYFGVNDTEPNWLMMDQMVGEQASAFAADALVTSHPIYVPVNHPNEINEIFDSISYQKGASILMMLDHFLTNKIFLKGLNSYLNKYKYGNARTEDLWSSLSEASNGKYNITEIMDTWTRQMGYPVVNVTRDGSGYKLEQMRFLLDPTPDYSREKYKSPYGYKWYVPFEYITHDTVNEVTSQPITVWLNKTGGMIRNSPSNSWIKANPGQFGFYRVNYDQQGWNDLVSQMNTNHAVLGSKDRAGLLNDAFALARATQLGYETTLNLFDYVHNETEYIPWRAASDGISYIGSMFTKTSSAGRNYPKYILKKIKARYDELGFRESKDGPNKHLETYLRSIILFKACGNGMPECLANATSFYKKWMEDPIKNKVPADLRSLVYFYGIMNGGEKEWDFAFKQFRNTTLATERIKLLYGMSATQEPWLIERYLNYSLDGSKIKSQDTSYVFSYVSNSNPIGRYYAWYFLQSNWDRISATFGGGFFSMRRIFYSVTSGFKTNYELKQFDRFVSTLKNTGTATRTITQSRETIKANIEWLARNEMTIANWLKMKV